MISVIQRIWAGCAKVCGLSHERDVQCRSGCPADTNGDGVVNVTDLLNLLAAWGSCPGF